MISVIICSASAELLAKVSLNIEATIGVPFEIIAFDNSLAKLGICKVYNNGANKAKYDILCFMHEDLIINTINWGEIVIQNFNSNQKLGLIGVAGSLYKSTAPSTWHSYADEAPKLLQYNLIQHYKFCAKEKELKYSNPTGAKLIKVASVDGLWFCCTRQAFNAYTFDQDLLSGFHGYDLDFSLGIGQQFDVAVTFEILMEHFSEGNTNKAWLADVLKVHQKWSSILPINLAELSKKEVFLLEKRGFRNIINLMRNEGFDFLQAKKMLLYGKKSTIMSSVLFLKLYIYLVKTFMKRR